MRKILQKAIMIFVFASLIINSANALNKLDNNEDDKIEKKESIKQNDSKTKYSLSVIQVRDEQGFAVEENNDNYDLKFDFAPNPAKKYFIGISYKDLNFSTFVFTDNDNALKYGKTDTTDLDFEFFKNSFEIKAFFSRYKGFHVTNFTKPDGNHYAFPNLTTKRWGVSSTYFVSDLFFEKYVSSGNFKEVILENEGFQIRAAATVSGFFDSFEVKNVPYGSELPIERQHDWSFVEINNGKFHTLGAEMGFFALAGYRPFFISTKFAFGIGAQAQDYTFTDGRSEKNYQDPFLGNLELKMGYIGRNIDLGVSAVGNYLENQIDKSVYSTNRFRQKIYLVIRWD